MRGHFESLGTIQPRGFGKRRVRAYVPAAADGSPRPLLLMFDGQNLFDDAGGFAGGWNMDRAVERVARARAPIVVGIDHGGRKRIDELTPFGDGARGGRLDAFLAAVTDDLLPRLHARFAIRDLPIIGGSSLGGLASLYAHFLRPDRFGGALAMSPSLWFTQARFAAFLRARPAPPRSRIYLDIGVREGDGQMKPLVDSLGRELRKRGWRATGTHRLLVRIDPRGRHHESSWARRLTAAVRFVVGS
ncbi:MAG: alpha/beta hydrolase-fold protein [Kofleriaceae bacterium]|nr:alpha/beta hydrolase-fold protein [Kofleriaceae bacterium]